MNNDNLRLLIVDDDPDVLVLTEKLLHKKYEVMTAQSGEFALEILNSIEVHGLISDINMPAMDGFELLRRIKKLKHLQNLTIAMLTGVRERKGIEKAINLGVNDYIVKPIDPMLFLKKIDNLFHGQQQPNRDNQFVRIQMHTEAFIKNKIKVQTVSELGLCITSNQEQKLGDIVELDLDLFTELNIRAPHLKVLSCKENSENFWTIHLGFVGASEAIRQKLRAWIYKQSTKNKAVA